MDLLVTDTLIEVFMISLTFSIILMALIQKFKTLKILNKGWHAWVLNLIFSFLVGIPFAISFYELNIILALWVAFLGFIGAPSIYEIMKNQNMINYKPKSTTDNKNTITIEKENEIKRN